MNKIDKNITIEELIEKVPGSVQYLMVKGIKCIACGEPIWGSLYDAALKKGFSEDQVESIVDDLNRLMEPGD